MPQFFDLSQPAWQVVAVVFFLIPGLNATWVVERLEGRTTLSAGERLIRAISWSVLIYLAASNWLITVGVQIARGQRASAAYLVILFGVLVFVAPVVLGLLVVWLRRGGWFRSLIARLTSIHPAPTAWDFAFAPAEPHFIRVKLKSGELLGGFFGDRSFASAYPEPQDLFLEEAWSLDPSGSFIRRISGSEGLLLRADTLDRVELLSVSEDDGR